MSRAGTFALSGAECVGALSLLGFDVVSREPGRTILKGRGRIVVVPDEMILPTIVLDAILAIADVSYRDFIHILDEVPTEKEAPTISG